MHRLIWLLLPLCCTACARLAALEGPPKSLVHLADEAPPALVEAESTPAPKLKDVVVLEPSPSADTTLQQATAAGTPPPPPALLPATVYPVWVPDHLTDDDTYVTGHWVYILQEPARWPLPRIPTPATVKVPRPPEPSGEPGAPRGPRPVPQPQGQPASPAGLVPVPTSPSGSLPGLRPSRPLLTPGVPGQGPLTIPGLFPPGGTLP